MFNIRTAMHSCCGPVNAHFISIRQVSSLTQGVVIDPSVGLNYTPATRAGTVVCPATAADTALGSLLI